MAHLDPLPLSQIEDPELLACIPLMEARGTPRREGFALFAHHPEGAKAWFQLWRVVFQEGLLDHRLKELLRIKTAALIGCPQ